MYTVSQIKKVLVQEKIATKKEIKEYLKESEKKDLDFLEYLVKEKIVEEQILYQLLAQSVNKPFVQLKEMNIRSDILFLIPEPIAQAHQIIAFDKTEDEVLKIAAIDPDDIQTFEFVEKKSGLQVDVSLTSPEQIKHALRLYHQGLEAELKEFSQRDSHKDNVKGEELKKLASDLPVVRLVNSMLEYAIFEGASDIHIEPQEKELYVRYRIDGVLRPIMTLPKKILSGIVARIKILSNLKLDEHRLPQDGRFKIETSNYKISFRVSIIPVFYGEKIVMRVLDEGNQLLDLQDLGFRKQDLKKIKIAIEKPYGMILVTGPTGSGKTTTLYSILNRLNTSEVNIATIEDPIEYQLPHINQTQINPKINFTFASGLRSLLRQDPDIIMVGEIRDQETAEIAIHAAMTGHKVLSTLHTNDSSGTLPRLAEMGIPSFLVASTVNIVLAQRLVRKICKHCIMSYKLDKKAIQDLSDQLDIKKLIKMLQEQEIIENDQKKINNLLFFKGKGCKKCGNTGYKGRLGIYEVLEVSEEIKELILNKASAAEIDKKARQQGMTKMLEDGLVKAKKGITTIEEVLRVTKD